MQWTASETPCFCYHCALYPNTRSKQRTPYRPWAKVTLPFKLSSQTFWRRQKAKLVHSPPNRIQEVPKSCFWTLPSFPHCNNPPYFGLSHSFLDHLNIMGSSYPGISLFKLHPYRHTPDRAVTKILLPGDSVSSLACLVMQHWWPFQSSPPQTSAIQLCIHFCVHGCRATLRQWMATLSLWFPITTCCSHGQGQFLSKASCPTPPFFLPWAQVLFIQNVFLGPSTLISFHANNLCR